MPSPTSEQQTWTAALWSFVRRYFPAEVIGTLSTIVAAWLVADRGTGVVVLVALIGESIGFYGTMVVRVAREQWPQTAGGRCRRLRCLQRSVLLLVAEFGPSEILDSILFRPGLMMLAITLTGDPVGGTLLGKVVADLAFYVTAATAYRVTVRTGVRQLRRRRPSRDHTGHRPSLTT